LDMWFLTCGAETNSQTDIIMTMSEAMPGNNNEGHSTIRNLYTVKTVRISTDILWRVVHILIKPVPYTLLSVNRRNNKAWDHITMLKCGKLATKYPWI